MKKVELDLIRQLVREEFMRGVPDFRIRQLTDDCVNGVRDLVMLHVQQRAASTHDRSDMTTNIDTSLNELSEKLYELVSDELFRIVNRM